MREKRPKVRTQADERKKILLAERKKEKERKKDWIIASVEEVVKKGIKKGDISWWSFL